MSARSGSLRLVEMIVVDAVDGAVGEHRQAERRGEEEADEVVEPARLEAAVVRRFVGEHGERVLHADDADDGGGDDERGGRGARATRARRRSRRRRARPSAAPTGRRAPATGATARAPRRRRASGRRRGTLRRRAHSSSSRRVGGERLAEQRGERAPLAGVEAAQHVVLRRGQRLEQRVGLLLPARRPAAGGRRGGRPRRARGAREWRAPCGRRRR